MFDDLGTEIGAHACERALEDVVARLANQLVDQLTRGLEARARYRVVHSLDERRGAAEHLRALAKFELEHLTLARIGRKLRVRNGESAREGVESHKIVALLSSQDVEALLAFAPVLRGHDAQCCTRRREVPEGRRLGRRASCLPGEVLIRDPCVRRAGWS